MVKFFCNLCQRSFKDEKALQAHLRDSKLHRQTSSLQVGQGKTTDALTPDPAIFSTNFIGQPTYIGGNYLTPAFGSSVDIIGAGLEKTVPHWGASNIPSQTSSAATPQKGILTYCEVCQRRFPHEQALKMHVTNSKFHKRELPKWGEPQHTGPNTVLNTGSYKQQASIENALPILAYSLGTIVAQSTPIYWQAGDTMSWPMQPLANSGHPVQDDSTHPISTSKDFQQLNAINSTPWNGNEASFQRGDTSWSLISVAHQPELLEALLKHCHSLEDLIKNRYVLGQYSANDIARLRRCKN